MGMSEVNRNKELPLKKRGKGSGRVCGILVHGVKEGWEWHCWIWM